MNTGNHTISSSLLIPLMSFANGKGVLIQDICNDSGVDAQLVHNADARVTIADADKLVASASRLTGEPSMPVKVGYRLGTRSCNLLQHLMMVSPDLASATRQQQKFHRLFTDEQPPVLSIDHDGQRATMEYFFESSGCVEGSQQRILISMTGHLHWLRMKCGKHFTPLLMELTINEPTMGQQSLETSLGCAVRFNAARNAIVFDERNLYVESVFYNQHLLALMEKQCAVLAQQLSSQEHYVANALRHAMQNGQLNYRANIEHAAEFIGVSTRTLNRYLKSEGTNFKTLLSEERIALASRLLRESECCVEDIAHDVGYSSRRAFDRAFTQAVGMSPAAVRKQAMT